MMYLVLIFNTKFEYTNFVALGNPCATFFITKNTDKVRKYIRDLHSSLIYY